MTIPRTATDQEDQPPILIPYGRQSIDEADIVAVTTALRSDWLTKDQRSRTSKTPWSESPVPAMPLPSQMARLPFMPPATPPVWDQSIA